MRSVEDHPDHPNDPSPSNRTPLSKIRPIHATSRHVPPQPYETHHDDHAGLNPLVDAASYLFSHLGMLKQTGTPPLLIELHHELTHNITSFHELILARQHYSEECARVCLYVICATFDDLISQTKWGDQGKWDAYSILLAFDQDLRHHDTFFSFLDRIIGAPEHYIDLMEFMYLCLSLGYKGRYRQANYSQYELTLITHNLYNHIRIYRGNVSLSLSPAPLKAPKRIVKPAAKKLHSSLLLTLMTASLIMIIFISLAYLMDVISNEAYTITPAIPITGKSSSP